MTALDRLVEFYRDADGEVEHGLLLVSELFRPDPPPPEASLAVLDALAAEVAERSPEGVAAHLFGVAGFVGDIDDYHAMENSFLDVVLERRVGMPITLAAVLIAVARRCGVALHGVGMPGHFLVGVDQQPGTYIDAFAGGVVLDTEAAEARFRSVAGSRATFHRRLLRPVTSQEVVSRVLNNLGRSFTERAPQRLDLLIDVRAALPVADAERQLVIALAESRARWDVAAQLREQLDPADPAIVQLRARLN